MNIKDKQLLNKAIENTDILSPKQKMVFKIICESEYPVSSVTIENLMKVSRQAVYLTLKVLLDRDFINRKKERVFLYSANKLKLFELMERYKFSQQ
jgi:predicted transcriptional regulator